MRRVDAPEILDSDSCSHADVAISMLDLGRVNRWFGGVLTTQKMVERVARVTGANQISLLEVAAGSGEVPELVKRRLALRGITLDVTLLDRAQSHLPLKHVTNGTRDSETNGLVGDALAMPFRDGAFDLVSCNLFAHHLDSQGLSHFAREALRVSRKAFLVNDLVRHPFHLGLAYTSRPLMRSRIAWLDGVTSVRRAYVPGEIRELLVSAAPGVQVEISRNYLFRMGVIAWKEEVELSQAAGSK